MVRRSIWFYIGLVLAFTSVLMRCFILSCGKNAQTAQKTVSRRQGTITLYRTRGVIYDETMKEIAGNQSCLYAVIDPREFPRGKTEYLIEKSKGNAEKIKEKLKKETPFVLKLKEDIPSLDGVTIFEGEGRYSGVATHLLGYLDEAGEVGVAGVEKEYDSFLNLFSSEVTVHYSADALDGLIAGLGMETKMEEATENGIVLSLNKDLCIALERSMDRYIDVGAAVILNCKNGEIKAVCSNPGYEEERIAEYLDSTNGELINRAFSAQTVGSVFKIIVAACVLEAGMEDFKYTCNGGIQINDYMFACHHSDGHGEVGLEKAFAESCNAYFIAAGQLLGYEKMAEMAHRFGYEEKINVLGSISASKGTFSVKGSNIELANMSIGQGELTSSPLQVARMTAVVANGGLLQETRLFKGTYINGKIKNEKTASQAKEVLSKENAEKLRRYCVETIENGTGKEAKPSYMKAGGKTASAQTGIIKNGKEKINTYFTGFYPAEDPQYVVTVFAEDGVSGGKTCGPVFQEMCDFITENHLTE